MSRKPRELAPASFSPALLSFLRALRRNNDRDWFDANRERYEQQVKQPLLGFIVDFAPRLQRISEHLVADPRPVGGSMFRIHRDTRFARDKSPYKTMAAVQFRHERGKDVHAPGFYLHLEPGACFAGGGIWRPDGKAVAAIRQAILDAPEAWTRAVSGKAFRGCTLGGDSLKRAPRGVDPDHPLIEHLKRKDFVASVALTDAEVCEAGFVERFARTCDGMAPLMRFLCGALELPF